MPRFGPAQLSVKGPVGAFRYPAGDDRPLVLLAGGIGITPLISMLRHAVSTDPMRPVTLLYGAHTDQDFAFRDELVRLARRHPQLHVHLAVAGRFTAPRVYPGRIDESLLRGRRCRISRIRSCSSADRIRWSRR